MEHDLIQRTLPSSSKLCATLGPTAQNQDPTLLLLLRLTEPSVLCRHPQEVPRPRWPCFAPPGSQAIRGSPASSTVQYLPFKKGTHLSSLRDLAAGVCAPCHQTREGMGRAVGQVSRLSLPLHPTFLASPQSSGFLLTQCLLQPALSARFGMAYLAPWVETQCSSSFCAWPLPHPSPVSSIMGFPRTRGRDPLPCPQKGCGVRCEIAAAVPESDSLLCVAAPWEKRGHK